MKSILIINSGALPVPAAEGGAIQTVFETLAIGLAKRGWKVGVLTYSSVRSRDRERDLESYGISWHHISERPNSGGIRGLISSKQIVRRSMKKIPETAYQNVILFDGYLASLVKKQFPAARIIWHVHNIQKHKFLLRSAASNSQLIACISDYVRTVTEVQAKGVKCVTINNPIDDVWFSRTKRKSDSELILFSGRIVPEKGLHVLASALHMISQDVRAKIRLVIAGAQHFSDSPTKSSYISSVDKLLRHSGVEHEWLGYVPRDKLLDWYDAASILVVPSTWSEPATLTSVEGQLRGCVVIGSCIGGIPEVIAPAWRDLLFAPNSPKELATKIQKAICMPVSERAQRASQALSFCEGKFSEAKVIDIWERQLFV